MCCEHSRSGAWFEVAARTVSPAGTRPEAPMSRTSASAESRRCWKLDLRISGLDPKLGLSRSDQNRGLSLDTSRQPEACPATGSKPTPVSVRPTRTRPSPTSMPLASERLSTSRPAYRDLSLAEQNATLLDHVVVSAVPISRHTYGSNRKRDRPSVHSAGYSSRSKADRSFPDLICAAKLCFQPGETMG